jgi:uncharacterized membrane-anchored protein YhcB (DUF1043 family)
MPLDAGTMIALVSVGLTVGGGIFVAGRMWGRSAERQRAAGARIDADAKTAKESDERIAESIRKVLKNVVERMDEKFETLMSTMAEDRARLATHLDRDEEMHRRLLEHMARSAELPGRVTTLEKQTVRLRERLASVMTHLGLEHTGRITLPGSHGDDNNGDDDPSSQR